MSTVQEIITDSRYDLGDFGGQKYNDVQMLHHMNRIVKILDDILVSLESDYTKTSSEVILLTGDNTVSMPTRSDKIQWVWYGTDRLLKEPLDTVMYRFQLNDATSTTGLPSFWAYNNANLYFNIEADADYTFNVYHHIKTDTLSLTDDMPYNDEFNQYLREAIVSMAQKVSDNQIPGVDQQWYGSFKNIVERHVVSRGIKQKNYHIDF